MKDNKPFEVSDMYTAVFIRTKYKRELLDIRKEGNKFIFIFKGGEIPSQELIKSFYSGNDVVSANAFVKEIKNIKSLIHSC